MWITQPLKSLKLYLPSKFLRCETFCIYSMLLIFLQREIFAKISDFSWLQEVWNIHIHPKAVKGVIYSTKRSNDIKVQFWRGARHGVARVASFKSLNALLKRGCRGGCSSKRSADVATWKPRWPTWPFQSSSTKSYCFRRAFNESHPGPAFVELSMKVILLL